MFQTPHKIDQERYNSFASSSKDTVTDSPATVVSARAPFMLGSHSIGSLWSVAMTQVKHATTIYEVVECLRTIRTVLQDIDRRDRLRFCKSDYDNAVKALRKNKQLWNNDLFRETIKISLSYFDISPFQRLPLVLFYEIIMWLPSDDLYEVLLVNSDWLKTCSSNDLWKRLYQRKFLDNNPSSSFPKNMITISMISHYKYRLEDPEIGDKIEVSWKGKFRLETQDVYQGTAWWRAEIVDKQKSQGKYRIRYPGWESRWDEWVPRSRLRWTVPSNAIERIDPGDRVELWCCGVNVPGAWLESKVKKVRGTRYCLGKVVSSGNLWVERDRLRLVCKEDEESEFGYDEEGHPLRRRRSRSNSHHGESRFASLTRGLNALLSRQTNCTIM